MCNLLCIFTALTSQNSCYIFQTFFVYNFLINNEQNNELKPFEDHSGGYIKVIAIGDGVAKVHNYQALSILILLVM